MECIFFPDVPNIIILTIYFLDFVDLRLNFIIGVSKNVLLPVFWLILDNGWIVRSKYFLKMLCSVVKQEWNKSRLIKTTSVDKAQTSQKFRPMLSNFLETIAFDDVSYVIGSFYLYHCVVRGIQ